MCGNYIVHQIGKLLTSFPVKHIFFFEPSGNLITLIGVLEFWKV